jgi:hypothetical protein
MAVFSVLNGSKKGSSPFDLLCQLKIEGGNDEDVDGRCKEDV